jgi:ankyrin repeat protein
MRLLQKRNTRVSAADVRGWSALHWAVWKRCHSLRCHLGQVATGDAISTRALLQSKKASIGQENFRGETCIHLAAREGNLEVEALILCYLLTAADS